MLMDIFKVYPLIVQMTPRLWLMTGVMSTSDL